MEKKKVREMKKYKLHFNDNEDEIVKQKKRTYIVVGFIALIYFILGSAYQYSDLLITSSHGIEVWTALFSGNLFDYYNITYTDISNSGYEILGGIPGYDFLLYIIFSIWNFPLWIVKYIFKVNIWHSVLALTWIKGIVFFFSILTVKKIVDLCKILEMEKNKIYLSIGLFFSSSIYILGAMEMSQYDVIYLFMLVASVEAYLKNDMKKFILWSAIAFPIKSLSFFIFLPLLLYKEKNLIKIFVSGICVLIPWGILRLLFERNSNSGILDNMMCMFSNKIYVMDYEIPLFPFAIFIFYLLCYLVKPNESKNKFNRTTLMIAFLAYQIFFVLCMGNAYWAVVMLPFQILFMTYDRINGMAILISTCSDLFYVINRIWAAQWSLDTKILKGSFIGKICGERSDDTDNILQVIQKYIPSLYSAMESRMGAYTYALFFIFSCLLFWVVLSPKKYLVDMKDRELKWILGLRVLASIIVFLLPVIAFIF